MLKRMIDEEEDIRESCNVSTGQLIRTAGGLSLILLSRSVTGGLPAVLWNASRLYCDISSSRCWKGTLRLMRNASNSLSSKMVQRQLGHLQEDHGQVNTIWRKGPCQWKMQRYIYQYRPTLSCLQAFQVLRLRATLERNATLNRGIRESTTEDG